MPHIQTPEEQETLETYNKIASCADTLWNAHFQDIYWTVFAMQLPKRAVVLDLGCGTARDAEFFLADELRYVGIDFSIEMLKVGTKNAGSAAKLLGMDMYELAFRDEVFDGFYAVASLMHIPRKNLDLVLQECRRVLKHGGVGFIATPIGTFEGMYGGQQDIGVKTLAVCWTPEALATLLASIGFTLLLEEQVGYMLIYVVQKH